MLHLKRKWHTMLWSLAAALGAIPLPCALANMA